MKSLMVWSVAAVLVSAATGLGLAGAAEPDAVKPAESRRLTDEGLANMLKGLGYEVTTTKSADGKISFHRIDKVVGTFRYIIDVSLQDDGKTLAFSIPLKKVGEPDKVPAEKLWALLSKNDEILPMSFSYVPSWKQFFLNLQVENRDLTPEKMQELLDTAKHQINATASIWDTSKWPGGPQPAAQLPADKAQPK